MIFCRILLHIISLEKHFPMSFFETFLQWIIWVCSDIIAMLCKTLINIKIKQFELTFPASNYLFNVKKWKSRKSYEICLKLTIETLERCHWARFGFLFVNLEHISHLFLVFTVDFEQLAGCWIWTFNVHLQWKLSKLKWTPTGPIHLYRVGFRRCPLWKGAHFRKSFLEMRLKWRKTHKRGKVGKQKHSTYHYPDQPIDFYVI